MSDTSSLPNDARRFSRRTLLAAPLLAAANAQDPPAAIDLRQLISRADLVYEKPVERSEEGMPIGNGRMGSLVWSTPRQLRFQINRADVYANDSSSSSFFERHNDYCGGCGYLDLDFGPAAPPFPESGFSQRLSVYDGQLTIEGKDLTARIYGWPARDVIAITVDDRRPSAEAVIPSLRMLRYETKYFGGDLEKFARDHVNTVRAVQSPRRIAADRGWQAHRADPGVPRGRVCCKSRGGHRDRRQNGAAPRIVQ